MSAAIEPFRHCPRCGSGLSDAGRNPIVCAPCDFKWFSNAGCATGAFLFDADDRVLFIRRAHEPKKGYLAIPGGFIDPGETAEGALRREILEEVGLEIDSLRYVCSQPNRYNYAGVTYDVCDFIFAGTVENPGDAQMLDGVADIEWRRLEEVSETELAFPSIIRGRAMLLEERA
jgi:NAD+ diphosphatase